MSESRLPRHSSWIHSGQTSMGPTHSQVSTKLLNDATKLPACLTVLDEMHSETGKSHRVGGRAVWVRNGRKGDKFIVQSTLGSPQAPLSPAAMAPFVSISISVVHLQLISHEAPLWPGEGMRSEPFSKEGKPTCQLDANPGRVTSA